MTNNEFVKNAKDIANNYKTLYVLGCFGSPMNATNKKRYTSNYSYNKSRASIINAASSDTFGFDCVCLIKGILWGWNGNANKTYGGAIIGGLVALVLCFTRIYAILLYLVLIIAGALIGNYIQYNKENAKIKLKEFIDKV